MEESHRLGLYVSYYLSRFNKIAYNNLGYGNMLETHNRIGKILSVQPNTVKNWRDEFDPLFGHRAGWYQRPMNPSRVKVAVALEELDEISIRSIVKDILSGEIYNKPNQHEQLILITNETDPKSDLRKFIFRTATGKAAEEVFMNSFYSNKTPFEGILIDCRNLGVGYDFRIDDGKSGIFIKIKELSENSSEVLFTNKEWQLANAFGDLYYLCIIKNTESYPTTLFIRNPSVKLNPVKNIHTVIQVSWSVSEDELTML